MTGKLWQETPLIFSSPLSQKDASVYLKLEVRRGPQNLGRFLLSPMIDGASWHVLQVPRNFALRATR